MHFSISQSKDVFSIKLILVFFAFISGLFFCNLGNRTFANPDEARYVEIAREMAISGDLVTPTLNGVTYLEKPPLFYWIQAANVKLFGIDFFNQRIPQAIIGLLGILAMFLFLKNVYNTKTAYISCSILSTSILYFIQARFINLDLLLSVLVAASLFCYSAAIINSIRPKLFLRLFYLFLALACLAKGLIGIVLPGIIILCWICLNNQNMKSKFEIIKRSIDLYGIILFLIISLPWHIACALSNPDFINFYFIHEHFHRYTTLSHNRFQPFYFFIPIVIAGLIPWTGFLFGKPKYFEKFKSDENFKFLCIWSIVIIAFFSCSNSKLIPYILPSFFPLASIIGIFIKSYLEEDSKFKYFNISLAINVFLLGLVIIYAYSGNVRGIIFNVKEFLNTMSISIVFLIGLCITVQKMEFKNPKQWLLIIHIIFAAYSMLIVSKILPYAQEISPHKASSYKIAQNIKWNLNDQVEVYCYNDYLQDLPIYLNRNVGTIDFVGELEFGVNHLSQNTRFLSEDDFFKKFESAKNRIFVCMRRHKFDKFSKKCNSEYRIIEVNKDFVVLINR